MADIAAIREGLAAALAVIPDLNESAYARSTPLAPGAEVDLGATTRKSMGRGTDEIMFTVRVFVASTIEVAAQKRLDLMIAGSGDTSISAALEADRTLGGACDSLHVTHVTGHLVFSSGHLGAEWTVRVIASGD